MKTTLAGLIPNTLHSAHIGRLLVAGVCMMSSVLHAAVDDWPPTAFFGFANPPAQELQAEMDAQALTALACIPVVQVSLDQNGQALITPGMLVPDPDYPLNMYVVDIMGPLTNVVTCDQIGQDVMVSVEELPTGNFCMSQLIVEDKLKPVMVCQDDTIPCNTDLQSLDYMSFLDSVTDNCDENPTIFFQYTIIDLTCDPDGFAGYVDITYTATDDHGNSNQCNKRIYLQKYTLDDVDFPADTLLNCDGADPDPDVIGGPTIEGQPIDLFCELISWYTDDVIPMCSGQTKILRLWRVMDWCTGEQQMDLQQILIVDTIPPDIVCPADVTIGTSLLHCSANYVIPTPVVTDVCSNDALINVRFFIAGIPGIFASGQQVELGLGPHVVTVSATDDCNNTGTCQYVVTVVDDVDPVLVCSNVNVTLGPDGMAFLNASSMTFNASDNCGIALRQVRRMDDNCNTPANLLPGPQVKFCCADVGQNVMVIFEATDLSGNVSTCMIQVNVKDADDPIALCRDAILYLGPDGTVTLPVDSIDNGSYDNCEITDRELSQTLFTCDDIGKRFVTLTVSDAQGNTASCSASVQVNDTVPPVAICQDITVDLNTMGMVTITVGMINNGSSDNCQIDTAYLSRYDFDCGDVGDNPVQLIVFDGSGNSDTCTATVTVNEMPPMVMCMDATLYLDEHGIVVVTPDDVDSVSDDCSMPTRMVVPDSLDCSNLGPNIVTLIATDDSGNTASCTATVTVLDTIAPECHTMDLTVQLDADGSVTLAGDALDNGSSDNCTIQSIMIDPDTFTCDDTGDPVIVIQTVTDQSGNTSTCTATVTVEDNLAPICMAHDLIVQLDADGMATIGNTALDNGSTDNCGIQNITIDQNMFDCADVGIDVIVTQTVTDVNGNTSTCEGVVSVEDNIDPTCFTQDITIELDASGMATITNDALDDGSSDACGIQSITLSQTDFDCGDVGDVTVTQTVTDVNGNSSTCSATVTVEDNMPPICMTQDITVNLGPDGTVTIDSNAVDNGSTDNCGIAMIIVDPNTFDCGSPDTVVVTQTVTDVNGNTSTCTANVIVMGGNAPQAVCMDITVFLDENGQVTITGDDVDGGSNSLCGDLMLDVDPSQFTCEDVGDNTVTLTVTDVTGTTATCTATVTVQDTLPPDCMTQDVTVFLDENGMASITVGDIDAGTTDNCGIDTMFLSDMDFTCSDVGMVTVTETAIDVNGNMCSDDATVTVMDTIPPFCATQDITVQLDGSGMATITPDQVDDGSTDNCGSVDLSVDPNMFTCDDLGDKVVVLTVTDGSGNTSTCTATVTVEDAGMLQANCQNLTVFLDQNGMVVVDPGDVDNGSGGGCFAGELTLELSQTTFNCTDVGVNTVTLTVTDMMGNTATCTATITVVDNTPPSITCPPNMTVNCDITIDIGNLSQFGNPTTIDNCPPVDVVENDVDNRNDCGQGTIVRTFTATDPSGNSSQCSQTITVQDPNPFDEGNISWPPAIVNLGQCSNTDPGPGNQPVIDAGTCTNISVDYQDSVVMTVDNDPNTPCLVITRMWTVIDSCQLMQGTQNGIFTFTQMIILNDNVGPIFTPLNDVTVNADTITCTAFVNLVTTATDCGIATPIENDYNDGGGDASDFFPVGVTTVTFTSSDPCGNISTMDVVVTVLDQNPATWMCIKIIRYLQDVDITIPAEEFVQFSSGSCSDETNYQFSYSPTDPQDTLKIFECHDIPGDNVNIYTFDLNGNPVDTCLAFLELHDTLGICPDSLVLSGEVYNESSLMIGDVAVLVSEPSMQTAYTDDNGKYLYEGLVPGNSYTIRPYKNDKPKQGVSALDLVAIQKHLLGYRPLDTPYKLIAADANNSGTITIRDLMEIRRLLLGSIPEFTNNTSWRFVTAEYTFPDPQNPWMMPFPEQRDYVDIDQNMSHQDYIAVKVGDVNNSVTNLQSGQPEVRSSNKLLLSVDDALFDKDSDIEIPVTVKGYQEISGYQFALQFNPDLAAFRGVSIPKNSFLSDDWFGLTNVDAGVLKTLWSEASERDLADDAVLFTLRLHTKASGHVSDLLSLTDDGLNAEAYQGSDETIIPVKLYVGDKSADMNFEVYQNIPNPFSDGTILPVQVPESALVTLEIYAADGRKVLRRTTWLEAGYHEFHVRSDDLPQGGVYYYTISTERFRGTRKMILLK